MATWSLLPPIYQSTRLALLMICSMDAENRTHRSELQPSGVELRTGSFQRSREFLVEAAIGLAATWLPLLMVDGIALSAFRPATQDARSPLENQVATSPDQCS